MSGTDKLAGLIVYIYIYSKSMKGSLMYNIMRTKFFGFQETSQTTCGQAPTLLLNIETI